MKDAKDRMLIFLNADMTMVLIEKSEIGKMIKLLEKDIDVVEMILIPVSQCDIPIYMIVYPGLLLKFLKRFHHATIDFSYCVELSFNNSNTINDSYERINAPNDIHLKFTNPIDMIIDMQSIQRLPLINDVLYSSISATIDFSYISIQVFDEFGKIILENDSNSKILAEHNAMSFESIYVFESLLSEFPFLYNPNPSFGWHSYENILFTNDGLLEYYTDNENIDQYDGILMYFKDDNYYMMISIEDFKILSTIDELSMVSKFKAQSGEWNYDIKQYGLFHHSDEFVYLLKFMDIVSIIDTYLNIVKDILYRHYNNPDIPDHTIALQCTLHGFAFPFGFIIYVIDKYSKLDELIDWINTEGVIM